MTDDKEVLTRRDFIRGAASAALAAAVGLPVGIRALAEPARKRSRVVLIRDKAVLDGRGRLNTRVLGRMLDEAAAKLLGKSDAASAWKALVRPTDFVGIKTNVWAYLPTPPELEGIIKRRVVAAGVPEERVFADDRGSRDKFERSTALINVRPARTHHWSGMGGCIKNYIVFVPDPPDYHDDACARLAEIWSLPIAKGKTRLNILVLLTPQFYSRGPHGFDRRYIWNYKGLAVSLDPVAVDAVGARLLRTKRILHFGEDKPLTPTTHIVVADRKYHLGVSDLNRIDLIKLGWAEDVLV